MYFHRQNEIMKCYTSFVLFFKKKGKHLFYLESIDLGLSNELPIMKIGAKLVEISQIEIYTHENTLKGYLSLKIDKNGKIFQKLFFQNILESPIFCRFSCSAAQKNRIEHVYSKKKDWDQKIKNKNFKPKKRPPPKLQQFGGGDKCLNVIWRSFVQT